MERKLKKEEPKQLESSIYGSSQFPQSSPHQERYHHRFINTWIQQNQAPLSIPLPKDTNIINLEVLNNIQTDMNIVNSSLANDSDYVPNEANDSVYVPNEANEKYLNTFPPGYRFRPHDSELIVDYLEKKVLNQPLPPNKIRSTDLYRYHPHDLVDMFSDWKESEWYFFTPRNRKYPNGKRPNRAADGGYWKATGADKSVKHDGVEVGFRKNLVFYQGKPPTGEKTSWIMHEYRLNQPPKTKKNASDMKLDDWVLCKLHKKAERAVRPAGAENEEAQPGNNPQQLGEAQLENNPEELADELDAFADESSAILSENDAADQVYADDQDDEEYELLNAEATYGFSTEDLFEHDGFNPWCA